MTKDVDLVIVGGGPAGLCAAITASSEGLSTAIVDSKTEWGGQSRDSSLIENYPGFPKGVTGVELAECFVEQAARFKTETLCPMKVISVVADGDKRIITTDDGDTLVARAVILAAGLSYNRLVVKNLAQYLGAGVSYGAPTTDFKRDKKNFYVVGGANSAGQAAVHLAMTNPKASVTMLVRGASLTGTMSAYLIEKINAMKNIRILARTVVQEVIGESVMRELLLKYPDSEEQVPADGLYIFIGASPKTFWLKGVVARDEKGFVLTDYAIKEGWQLERKPLRYECSIPGVFAAGDVRLGSTKRVVAATGEGSTAVQSVHAYLALNGSR